MYIFQNRKCIELRNTMKILFAGSLGKGEFLNGAKVNRENEKGNLGITLIQSSRSAPMKRDPLGFFYD